VEIVEEMVATAVVVKAAALVVEMAVVQMASAQVVEVTVEAVEGMMGEAAVKAAAMAVDLEAVAVAEVGLVVGTEVVAMAMAEVVEVVEMVEVVDSKVRLVALAAEVTAVEVTVAEVTAVVAMAEATVVAVTVAVGMAGAETAVEKAEEAMAEATVVAVTVAVGTAVGAMAADPVVAVRPQQQQRKSSSHLRLEHPPSLPSRRGRCPHTPTGRGFGWLCQALRGPTGIRVRPFRCPQTEGSKYKQAAAGVRTGGRRPFELTGGSAAWGHLLHLRRRLHLLQQASCRQ
jgi:hypothetical protein